MDKHLAQIPATAGTYILLFETISSTDVQIGRLGPLSLETGIYAYIGSAFGPGGIRARINHHLHSRANPHWHLDYLRQMLIPKEAWFVEGHRQSEHRWAESMASNSSVCIPLAGFGASDCACRSHFFNLHKQMSINRLFDQACLSWWQGANICRYELFSDNL